MAKQFTKTIVEGVDQVIKGIRSRKKAHEDGFVEGLKEAGEFVKTESQKIVPFITGKLHNSAFVRINGKGFDSVLIVGYRAPYAIWVHERVDLKHAKGKSAKFLEIPIRRHETKIARIIANRAKAGK